MNINEKVIYIEHTMSSKKSVSEFANHLLDKNDRLGTIYRQSENILFSCFICKLGLSPYTNICHVCNYNYHLCSSCYEDSMKYVFPSDRCIYCERIRNDKIMDQLKLLRTDLKIPYMGLVDDLFGRKQVDLCIDLLEKE